MPGPSRAETLLPLADDELIVGWRNSEWTGIAPFLEEDVAFSSIAQNEIGHARALYEIVAEELGSTADELAFDRPPGDYRARPSSSSAGWTGRRPSRATCSTRRPTRSGSRRSRHPTTRSWRASPRGIDREEVYHRMHAEMWLDRLLASADGRARLDRALDELWPYGLGVLDEGQRPELRRTLEERLDRALPDVEPAVRGRTSPSSRSCTTR